MNKKFYSAFSLGMMTAAIIALIIFLNLPISVSAMRRTKPSAAPSVFSCEAKAEVVSSVDSAGLTSFSCDEDESSIFVPGNYPLGTRATIQLVIDGSRQAGK